MKSQSLPIVAIVASLIAIAVSLARKNEPAAGQAAALEKLERRLRILEFRSDSPQRSGQQKLSGLTMNNDASTPAGIAADDGSVDALRDRQAQLENQLADLGVLEHFEKKRKAIDESYTVALNPEANSKGRLEALGLLRRAKRIDAEVVTSMVDLWAQSLEDESGGWTRWFLMENLEGVQSPEFRDSILEWIPGEESPKMRSRAIETLGSMLPDPTIDEWLDYLGENDPEPELRQQAAATRAAATDSDTE